MDYIAKFGVIGKHFPDTDAAYKDADSRVLLREVMSKLSSKSVIHQVDLTVLTIFTPGSVAKRRAAYTREKSLIISSTRKTL